LYESFCEKNTIVAADKEIAGMPGDVKQTWIQTGYPHLAPASEQVPALDRSQRQADGMSGIG
jgi:hypothetical protein